MGIDLVCDLPPVKCGTHRKFGADWLNGVDFHDGQTEFKIYILD